MKDSKHRKPVQFGPNCRWDGGSRAFQDIKYIVIHSAESPSDAAQGVARYGSRTDRKVSWHVVVDNNLRIRQLPDNRIAWTAPPCNSNGLNVEICGRASYSRLQWYQNQASLKRAAWQVAEWCKTYGIPVRELSDQELDRGYIRGIITHAQVSRVFKISDHTDPGRNFPMRYFMLLVRRRLKWITS